jgi:hypothetical protein
VTLRSATDRPGPLDWLPSDADDHETVPTFTMRSIDQGGAQLYPGSIATATPQTFTMASPPEELTGFGVDDVHHACVVVRCRPAQIRQIPAGFAVTGLPPLVHSRCTF